jgi:histidyl-tRNA synthetase
MISKVKGTQDFLDMALFNYIINTVRKVLTAYHFHEISTPIIDPLELFVRTTGQETDIVTKEMFLVESTHKDADAARIALRPEATPSAMRAFLEQGNQSTPWKVFLWGPMFRHERPQKGRFRQFNQISMEVIGSNSIAQDIHFITMLDRMFSEQFKLDTYALLINFLGCSTDRKTYKEALAQFLDKNHEQICGQCRERRTKNIMRVLDCKTETCKALYQKAPQTTEHLCTLCAKEWQQLQDMLTMLSVAYTYSPTLVRGLDYYAKTVFEFASSALGAQSTFCGGGRYEYIATQLGSSQDFPSIGAAIGVERLMLLLENHNQPLPSLPPLNVIIPVAPEQHALALLLADELQAQGHAIEILLESSSMKSMMRTANKLGAQHSLILGDEEQKTHQVTVKNMMTGEEQRIAQSELGALLRR